MLLNDFFSILRIERNNEVTLSSEIYTVLCRINSNHRIFEGHFPENPVVPGVCLVEMIKECIEEIKHQKLFLTESSNIKFLNMVNPIMIPELMFEINFLTSINNNYKIKTMVKANDSVFLKFEGIFEIIKSTGKNYVS